MTHKLIGRNQNKTPISDMSGSEIIGDSLSVEVLEKNDSRISYAIYVESGAVWIKEQSANVDNNKSGIVKVKCGQLWEQSGKVDYSGAVSLISHGGNSTVHITEW